MPIRTTPELVGGIIELDPVIVSIAPFIAAASALVDGVERRSDTLDSDEQLDSARLEIIETWLAAHFYAIRDPRPERERAGSVEVKHQTSVDLGLNVTHYGQQAMMLDTTGYLSEISSGKKRIREVSLHWVGTEIED